MKIYYFILALVVFSFCSPKVYKTLNWQRTPVSVDGNIADWANPLRYFDEKSKLNYTISNDKTNVYICIKAGDDATQAKILRGGMEIGIDTSAKKTFPISIAFPIAKDAGAKKRRTEGNEGEDTDRSELSKKQHLAGNFKEMKISGFLIPNSSLTPLNNGYGIEAALEVDKNDVLVYELVVPFKTFFKNELSPADTNKIMNYQIRINGIASAGNSSSGGSGGGGHHGGGGQGGGGMGGAGGGGMGGAGGGMGGSGGMSGGGSGGGPVNPISVADVVIITAKFSYKK